MSDTGIQELLEHSEQSSPDHQSPLSILYVSSGSSTAESVPTVLEAEHGMDVQVSCSLESAVESLKADAGTIDCVVSEYGGDRSAEGEFLTRIQTQYPGLPVLVYADSECGPNTAHECLQDGVDDYLSRDTDTGCCTLLSHRIERCVAHQQKQTEAQHFRSVVNRMGHAVLITDSSGRIEFVNQAFEDLFADRQGDLIGQPLRSLQSAGAETVISQDCWETVTRGESWNGELTVTVDESTSYSIDLTATPLQNDDGEVQRIVAVGKDISDRKERERKLAQYKAVVDSMEEPVWAVDRDREYTFVNRYITETLERPQADIVGRSFGGTNDEFVTVRNGLDRVHKQIDAILAGNSDVEQIELTSVHDGAELVRDVRLRPIEIDGERVGVVSIGRDVTERKQRERDLRSFQEAIEQAGHAIMITDTGGQIEYVNPAFEDVTGYTEPEALGKQPSILQSGEHDNTFYRELWETLLSGDVWEGELVNERKDGERYHIEQTIAPITDEEGTIERFVAVNTDITDRKQYERQLERERDRLEEFSRTVAHDLRNPLSIALGHVELAQSSAGSLEDPLSKAIGALERMDILIDEVLTLSKQGETVHEPESVQLRPVVEKAWDHVETPTGTLSVEPTLSTWSLKADETRLCELLENFFRNAVDHAGPDVHLTVGRLQQHEGFFVEDDGTGIPPEHSNRIFETGYTGTDGTGFGLAIVKQIVDGHGWEITVTDSATGGARFEIITNASRSTNTGQGTNEEENDG